MKRRIAQSTPLGTILVELPEGSTTSIISAGMTDSAELDLTDAEWQKLHKQVETGQLDFAKVKSKHGLIEEQQ